MRPAPEGGVARSLHRERRLPCIVFIQSAPVGPGCWRSARLRCALCRRQLGVQFRRQVVVGGYIADFAAPAVKLIVEVDGTWHRGRERLDARRDRALGKAGWRVVRLRAKLVLGDLPAAVALVREALAG